MQMRMQMKTSMQINNWKHQHVVSAIVLHVPPQSVDVKVRWRFPTEDQALITLNKFFRQEDVDTLISWVGLNQPLCGHTDIPLSGHHDGGCQVKVHVGAK